MDRRFRKPCSVPVLAGVLALLPLAALADVPVPTNLPGIRAHVAVPLLFDPVNASAEALRANGFPPRPDRKRSPEGFEHWRRAVASGAKRIMPNLVQTDIRHGPRIPRGRRNNTDYTANWSGVALVNNATTYGASSFYYVMGDYFVPRAQQAFGGCDGNWDFSATWVGIDGYNPGDVEQAGTEADAYCAAGQTASYYSAWFEWYPYGSVQIGGLLISPGDPIYVDVWNVSPTVGAVYLVDFADNEAVAFEISAPPGIFLIGNSAEWILERPLVGGGLAQLTNYSQDMFQSGFAGDLSYQVSTPGAPANGIIPVPIVMQDSNGYPISVPSSIGTAGLSFFDDYSARFAGAP